MIIKLAVAAVLAYSAVSGCGASNSHKPPACEGSKPTASFTGKPSHSGDVFTFRVNICASQARPVELFALASSASSAVRVSLTGVSIYITHYITPVSITSKDASNVTMIAATDTPQQDGCYRFLLALPPDGKSGIAVGLPRVCQRLATANA